MNLAAAIQAVTEGNKVKLPEWEGYWFGRDGKILVFTKTGDILDTPWFDKYENRTDFEICEPKLGFDFAIRCLKVGKKVARQGWNGKGMWLQYIPADCYTVGKGDVTLLPWVGMKTADDKFVPWLASQTDMLAEDWVILS